MKLIFNGHSQDVEEDLTISGLLLLQNVKSPDMVSVELNGEILEQSDFDKTTLKESDNVEFLFFMGGGSW